MKQGHEIHFSPNPVVEGRTTWDTPVFIVCGVPRHIDIAWAIDPSSVRGVRPRSCSPSMSPERTTTIPPRPLAPWSDSSAQAVTRRSSWSPRSWSRRHEPAYTARVKDLTPKN